LCVCELRSATSEVGSTGCADEGRLYSYRTTYKKELQLCLLITTYASSHPATFSLVMAEITPKKIPTATEKRTAALAAIEARARNGPLSSTPDNPSSNSTPAAWTPPSPEEDRKRKLELGRIVARDIMGSNNYTSAATCIEVNTRVDIQSRSPHLHCKLIHLHTPHRIRYVLTRIDLVEDRQQRALQSYRTKVHSDQDQQRRDEADCARRQGGAGLSRRGELREHLLLQV
jgi:hypothetical protein